MSINIHTRYWHRETCLNVSSRRLSRRDVPHFKVSFAQRTNFLLPDKAEAKLKFAAYTRAGFTSKTVRSLGANLHIRAAYEHILRRTNSVRTRTNCYEHVRCIMTKIELWVIHANSQHVGLRRPQGLFLCVSLCLYPDAPPFTEYFGTFFFPFHAPKSTIRRPWVVYNILYISRFKLRP